MSRQNTDPAESVINWPSGSVIQDCCSGSVRNTYWSGTLACISCHMERLPGIPLSLNYVIDQSSVADLGLCIRIQHPCDFGWSMNGLLFALFFGVPYEREQLYQNNSIILFLQVSMLPTRGEKSSGDLNILAIMQNAATIHEIRHLLLPRPFVPHIKHLVIWTFPWTQVQFIFWIRIGCRPLSKQQKNVSLKILYITPQDIVVS